MVKNYILDSCEHLMEGESKRLNHEDCPEGTDSKRRLWVIRTTQGISTYCHHCQQKRFYSAPIRNSLFAKEAPWPKMHSKLLWPADYTDNISTEGLLWLFKYDITLEEIKRYGIAYSNINNCVVLPVSRNNKVVYWIGRKLGRDKKCKLPRYTGPAAPGYAKVYNFYSTEEYSDTLVIVEDYLSAIKVGRVCKAVALFGTKIPNLVWQEAIKYKRVLVWLDLDAKKKSLKYENQLSLYTNAKSIVTEFDPKCYSTLEIQKILGDII